MDSYIIRIYRKSRSESSEEVAGPVEVAGLVEVVGADQQLSFQTFSGLVSAMKQVVEQSEAENKITNKLYEIRK